MKIALHLRFFGVIVLLCTSLSIQAQLTYEERIEFELNDGYNADFIIPQGKSGFMIIAENEDSRGKEVEWLYDYYNNKLEHEDSKKILIDKKFNSIASYTTEEATHTLYKHRKKGEFEIVTANKQSNELISAKGELPKKFINNQFYILGEYAYLTGVLKKSPTLFVVNWRTGVSRIIPIAVGDYKPKRTEISNFQVKPKDNEFLIFIKAYDSRKDSETFMMTGSDDQINSKSFKLGKTGTKNLIAISASKTDQSEYLITGTYGENSSLTSSGIFFGKVDGKKVSFLKFYNFLDLKDFLSYLPERKQEKVKKKKKRKENKGKELNFNYNIADHNILRTSDGGYILIGEAYYATYRTESRTTYVNGQSRTTYVRVFDGYQYTHAVISKFDKEGTLLWDNSFKMEPIYKPFSVKRFITIFGDEDNKLNLAFADEKRISTKSISNENGEVLKEETSDEIETGLEGDKTKDSYSRLDHWYDNYFIVYGNQKIKNKGDDKSKRGKRKVFFVSKVALNY